MKKQTMILFALLAIGVASMSLAFAYNPYFSQQPNAHYSEIQNIMTNGSYANLVTYRQTTGLQMMPWVENEQDFLLAQKMHTTTSQGTLTIGARKQGFGRRGGCPMFNDGDE